MAAATQTGGGYSGIIVNNFGSAQLTKFDSTMNPCKAAFQNAYTDSSVSTWAGLDPSSILSQTNGVPVLWSMANYPKSSSLAAAAGGAGNSYYTQWAQKILAQSTPFPDGNFYVRIMWEFPNAASGYTWTAQGAGKASTYIAAFRNFAAAFHAVSPRFKILWDTWATSGASNAQYWPGADSVDVISQDIYFGTYGSPTQDWPFYLNRTNGLAQIASWGATYGKPVAIPEWGIPNNGLGGDVTNFGNWMQTHNVVLQSYWFMNTGGEFNDLLTDYPAVESAYKQAFCSSGPAPSPTPVPPTPQPTVSPTTTPTPAPTPTQVPTPRPSPSPSPTGSGTSAFVAQVSQPATLRFRGALTATLPHVPAAGDVLVALIDSNDAPALPSGFTQKDGPGNVYFSVLTGVVGQSGLVASNSYSFGRTCGIVQMIDVTNVGGPVLVSSDPFQWQNTISRTLTLPRSGGIMLSGWGAWGSSRGSIASISEQFGSGQSQSVLGQVYNAPDNCQANSGAFSLRTAQVTTEPYAAAQPFTDDGTISFSNTTYAFNGQLIWIP